MFHCNLTSRCYQVALFNLSSNLVGLCWQILKLTTKIQACRTPKRTILFCMTSLLTWRPLAFTIHWTRSERLDTSCDYCRGTVAVKSLRISADTHHQTTSTSRLYVCHRYTSPQNVCLTSPSSTSCSLLLSCPNFNTAKIKASFFSYLYSK